MLKYFYLLAYVVSGLAFYSTDTFAVRTEDKAECVRLLTLNGDGNSNDSQAINVDWDAFRKNATLLGLNSDQIEEKITQFRYLTASSAIETLRSFHVEIGAKRKQLRVRDYKALSEFLGDLDQIGLYASLEGIDKGRLFTSVAKDANGAGKVEAFLLWAHLWLDGPDGMSVAKTLWSNTKSLKLAWLVFQRVKGPAREEFGTMVRNDLAAMSNSNQIFNYDDEFEATLKLAHYIPKEFLPSNLIEDIYGRWINIKEFPPLEISAVSNCLIGFEDAGNCEYMTNGHFGTLGLTFEQSGDHRNSILIFVGGHLIGSFKLTGDPSMIGLRNVVDKKGNLLVAIGGVYRLPVALVESLRNVTIDQSEWSAVNLSELALNPSTFLLNDNAFSDTNSKDFINLGREHFSKDELIDYILNDGSLDGLMSAEKRHLLMPHLINALDKKRKQLESAFQRRPKAA